MKIMLDKYGIMPNRAHEADAGYDLYSPYDVVVKSHQSAVILTGVHVEIPRGYVGFLKSKSGLNIKYDITGEGVIDSGYTGEIVVKLRNDSDFDYLICCGDKIIQLVLLPIFTPELEQVDSLEATERGDNGFGSTGK